MTYTELSCCDKDASNDDVREALFFAMKKKFNGIVVSLNAIQDVKELAQGIDVISQIDFPLGNMDMSLRQHAAVAAARKGVNCLNVMASSFFIANKQFDKLSDDFRVIKTICDEYNVTMRAMIDYRILTNNDLLFLSDLIHRCDLDIIYPATHAIPDDVEDSIIIANVISNYSKLSVIVNPNIWQKHHYTNIVNSGVYGVQFRNIEAAKIVFGV